MRPSSSLNRRPWARSGRRRHGLGGALDRADRAGDRRTMTTVSAVARTTEVSEVTSSRVTAEPPGPRRPRSGRRPEPTGRALGLEVVGDDLQEGLQVGGLDRGERLELPRSAAGKSWSGRSSSRNWARVVHHLWVHRFRRHDVRRVCVVPRPAGRRSSPPSRRAARRAARARRPRTPGCVHGAQRGPAGPPTTRSAAAGSRCRWPPDCRAVPGFGTPRASRGEHDDGEQSDDRADLHADGTVGEPPAGRRGGTHGNGHDELLGERDRVRSCTRTVDGASPRGKLWR